MAHNPNPPVSLELINAYQMRQMDAAEKELYKQRLRAEIEQFRQRELMYNDKRCELLELEKDYRRN